MTRIYPSDALTSDDALVCGTCAHRLRIEYEPSWVVCPVQLRNDALTKLHHGGINDATIHYVGSRACPYWRHDSGPRNG